MLECATNFIGIRADKSNTEAPTSGLYIDDVQGIDLKRMANIASSETGLEMIKRNINMACDQIAEEALNYTPEKSSSPLIKMRYVGLEYVQSKFDDTPLSPTPADKGIEFEFRRPDFYQYSNLVIKRVHVRAAEDATGVVVRIIDGNNTVSLDPIDLVADEVYTIDNVNYIPKNRKFKVVTDHSLISFYPAYTTSSTGCLSCRGMRKRPYYSETYTKGVYVHGGDGVSADVSLECDTSRIKCASLEYLKYAVLYKTAYNLALEGLRSDRMNLYAAHADFDELMMWAEAEYMKYLANQAPNISRLAKNRDNNCFVCGGTTRTKVKY